MPFKSEYRLTRIERGILVPIVAFGLAMLAALSVSAPTQAEVVIPSEPRVRDIPKKNAEGKRVRGIAFFATNVMRLGDGETLVLYGFVVGQISGRSNFFFWNDVLDVSCFGTTTPPGADGLARGQNTCSRAGEVFFDQPFAVVEEKYGGWRGNVRADFADARGGRIQVMQRWQGRSQFPDPLAMIAELD